MSSSAYPLSPSEVDVSKIEFAEVRVNPKTKARSVNMFYNNSRLTVQFPLMGIAFNGVSKWENKDTKGNLLGYRYEMNLSFKGREENPRLEALHDLFEKLQEKFKKDGFENRLTWFQDNFDDEPKFVAKIFHPLINVSKDKETRKPDNKWPSTIKVKLPFDDATEKFTFEAHDMQKKELNFNEVWDQMKGGRAMPVMQLTSLWFAGGKFGATWRLVMSKFQLLTRNTFAYRDDEDDKLVGGVESDDEDDDIPQALINKSPKISPAPVVNTQIEDSDEEEDDDEAVEEEEDSDKEERTPTPPPPPPPAPKKKKPVAKAK